MAVTCSAKNYTQLSNCDTTTAGGTWAGNGITVETSWFKEGSACLGFTLRTVGNNDVTLTKTATDLSNKHLRIWFMSTVASRMDTDVNGGIQFIIGDGVNTGYWYVAGSTSYSGGWINLVVDTSRAADAGTKPTNMAVCTLMGIRVKLLSAPKNANNTWMDNFNVGDGIIAYGDSGGSDFAFSNILSADEATTAAWGIIRQISGVYFLVGAIDFGDASGTNSLKFKDTSQIVLFEDRKVSSTLYALTVVSNATGSAQFQFGNKSGSSGYQGCYIKSVGTAKYTFTCTDTDVGTMKLYGTSFVSASTISLPTNSANREVVSCNFEGCAEILPDTCVVKYCNVVAGSGTRALRITSTSHNVSDCNFIGNTNAVHFTTANTYNLSNNIFTNNTKDIENSSAGLVHIDCQGTTNASTYTNTGGGTTYIDNPKTLTIGSTSNPLQTGSKVKILRASTQVILDGTDSSSTTFTYNYTYDAGDDDIIIVIFHTDYRAIWMPYTLTATNQTIPVSQETDRTYYNPS